MLEALGVREGEQALDDRVGLGGTLDDLRSPPSELVVPELALEELGEALDRVEGVADLVRDPAAHRSKRSHLVHRVHALGHADQLGAVVEELDRARILAIVTANDGAPGGHDHAPAVGTDDLVHALGIAFDANRAALEQGQGGSVRAHDLPLGVPDHDSRRERAEHCFEVAVGSSELVLDHLRALGERLIALDQVLGDPRERLHGVAEVRLCNATGHGVSPPTPMPSGSRFRKSRFHSKKERSLSARRLS